jgi:hypothetical protein
MKRVIVIFTAVALLAVSNAYADGKKDKKGKTHKTDSLSKSKIDSLAEVTKKMNAKFQRQIDAVSGQAVESMHNIETNTSVRLDSMKAKTDTLVKRMEDSLKDLRKKFIGRKQYDKDQRSVWAEINDKVPFNIFCYTCGGIMVLIILMWIFKKNGSRHY